MKYFILLLTIFFQTTIFGQVYRHFLSTDLEKTYQSNPEWKQKIREKEIEFEQYYLNEFLIFEKDDQAEINVQVVFNILQTEEKKVSFDQIKAQLEALNAAFSNEIRMPDDDYYKDQAYSAGIKFCVPEYNDKYIRVKNFPNGTTFQTLFSAQDERGLEPYESMKFINIWVADLGKYDPTGVQEFAVAGYAQLPLRDPVKDGIVIDIDHFGLQPDNELYDKGYTLAHLMGIYLGIRPIWGLDGDGQCGGDGVDDTPVSNVPTYVCLPQTDNYVVGTGCWGNERRMNKNFMDNIPDECATMFTLGQRRKMHGNLGKKGPRGSLVPESPFGCESGNPSNLTEFSFNSNSIIKISPNPANSYINISLALGGNLAITEKKYAVYNLTGQIKAQGIFFNDNTEISVEDWTSGIYFIVVFDDKDPTVKNRYTSKFEVIK